MRLIFGALLALAAVAAAQQSATLYGIDDNLQLNHINPETGAMKAIGPVHSGIYTGMGIATIDQATYYTIAVNRTSFETSVYGIDLETGENSVRIHLSNVSDTWADSSTHIEYDPNQKLLMVWINTTYGGELLAVNPATKEVDVRGQFPTWPVWCLGCPSTFDPNTDRMWFVQLHKQGNRFSAYNAHTGQLDLQVIDEVFASTMDFTQTVGTGAGGIVGVGMRTTPNGPVRTLYEMTPDGKQTAEDFVSDFMVIDMAVSAFEQHTQRLSVIMTPKGQASKHLVTIDWPSKKIVSSPVLHEPMPALWNIVYKQ